MQHFATTPTHEYTTSASGCYNTLTILVFPFVFYLLQVLGLLTPIAIIFTGLVVLIKAVVEWSSCHQQHPHRRVRRCPVRPTYPARVLACECSLCGKLHRPDIPFDLGGGMWAPVCAHCRSCLAFSEQLTNPAMPLR